MAEMDSSNGNNSSSDHAESKRCFEEWMRVQEEGEKELFEALSAIESQTRPPNSEQTERHLKNLVDKSIDQFQNYIDRRAHLAKNDVSAFFAPAWCTARETSLLWLGGCRPSLFIRLAYSLTGLDMESRVAEFLQRITRVEEIGDLSAEQMVKVNDLQRRTVREEERLTGEMAKMQEEIADEAVVGMVMRSVKDQAGFRQEWLETALEKQDGGMLRIMGEADRLRICTLNELLEILKPLQAVMFLACSKKLHLCVREWGKRSDRRHGRLMAVNPSN